MGNDESEPAYGSIEDVFKATEYFLPRLYPKFTLNFFKDLFGYPEFFKDLSDQW
jgi:hypothetical protein